TGASGVNQKTLVEDLHAMTDAWVHAEDVGAAVTGARDRARAGVMVGGRAVVRVGGGLRRAARSALAPRGDRQAPHAPRADLGSPRWMECADPRGAGSHGGGEVRRPRVEPAEVDGTPARCRRRARGRRGASIRGYLRL